MCNSKLQLGMFFHTNVAVKLQNLVYSMVLENKGKIDLVLN
jgi:hypothetical protein